VSDPSVLRVANTHQFLLQAELRSIQQGLQYTKKVYPDGTIYNGYVKDGIPEGVGINIWKDGQKDIAEYHLNKLHGCGKVEI
jgi:hypothetical protein